MSKVFVGMSGGVDSSVAALLLKNEGHDVTGVFMRCVGDSTGPSTRSTNSGSPRGIRGATTLGVNCQDRDAEDARRVAEHLNIPFYVWDFEEEYKERVVKYMVDGYRAGITPNPDVMCNREIKFGLFFDRALAMGADHIATGHYVKLESRIENLEFRSVGRAKILHSKFYILNSARDSAKDQSYFLWTLGQKQLSHCLFPIGNYLKTEVREMARQAKLPTAEKKDSQGICFLGQVKLDEFLRQYINPRPGQVKIAAGDGSYKVIGEHSGAHFYTIGQRHVGINLQFANGNSRNKHAPRPHYVAEKDVRTNTVVMAEGSDNPALYKKEIALGDLNFIDPLFPDSHELNGGSSMKVFARVRYRQPLTEAKIVVRGSRFMDHGSKLELVFDEPQKFVAPGQSAVFYVNENPSSPSPRAQDRSGRSSQELRMLGGGIII
ncbi:MAG: tRNA 2-thiouridine(34) synthase MnmA [Candidatus Liptonbacteria bacterium]|nr:tRNA 2-thiouridine(34) synthase MnmA [Candidatus Liptonbacteria bacterium]